MLRSVPGESSTRSDNPGRPGGHTAGGARHCRGRFWPQWRGPHATGVSTFANPPTEWSEGWLHNRRSSGKIHFLTVRDGSGFIQAVMSKATVGDEVFKAADHLSRETSVIVTGAARADARAPSGYEVDFKSLQVVGE